MAFINCPKCERLVPDTYTNCPMCKAPLKAPLDAPQQSDTQQSIYVNVPEKSNSNGLGVAGFVLALIGLFIGWVPALGWIIWLLGAIFSFAGLFKQPRGLAIAGFVISFIDLLILLLVFGAGLSLLGALGAIGAAAS